MRKISLTIIALTFLSLTGCIGWYDKMSHLSPEELVWVDCYEPGNSVLFESDSGEINTLIVTKKDISNTRNPFFIHFIDNHPGDEFNAQAFYDFNIINATDNRDIATGSFAIIRYALDDSLTYFADLRVLYPDFPYNSIGMYNSGEYSVKIGQFSKHGRTFENCIVVDSINAKKPHYYEQALDCFVISRDDGLIYYRYKSGEEFFRKFD